MLYGQYGVLYMSEIWGMGLGRRRVNVLDIN